MSTEKKEPRRWWIETFETVNKAQWPQVYSSDIPNTIEVVEATALTEAEREIAELKSALEYHGDDYVKQVGTWKIVQRLEEERDTLRAQVEVFMVVIDHAAKRSSYAWSSGGTLRAQDYVNEGMIGLSMELLSKLKGGPDGKV